MAIKASKAVKTQNYIITSGSIPIRLALAAPVSSQEARDLILPAAITR